jgi:hypothetical protein
VKALVSGLTVIALLALQGLANARVPAGEAARPDDVLHAMPLLDWELPDVVAQQQPATTPPVLPVPPVTAPAAVPPDTAPDTPPAASEPPPAEPVAPEGGEPTMEEEPQEDDFSLGDIPVVETLELEAEKARKALDTYVLVREKYKDAELENFENLQDFVDQSPQGKAFDTDVKAAGFKDVAEWNTTITTLSFAYDNSVDDQTGDIKQQIAELQADTEMAQDMRDRMIKALNAMIPSDNNKKILEALKADPLYAEKLKLLETEAE